MTTKEEFLTAIKSILSCSATLACGCQYDKEIADELYYQCKRYIEEYKKAVK